MLKAEGWAGDVSNFCVHKKGSLKMFNEASMGPGISLKQRTFSHQFLFNKFLRKFTKQSLHVLWIGLLHATRTCLLAGVPTSRSPSAVKATTEGVVLDPSAFSSTFGVFPSITATQEFVVPRSMPQTAPRTASELQTSKSTSQKNCNGKSDSHTIHNNM